ncbi:hypothetical protein ACS0TY_000626 [Phlomoides rotata]
MANPGYPFQDRYFYGEKWSKPITLYLIDMLLTEKHLGQWQWNDSNTLTIMAARDRVNAHFEKEFRFNEVLGRVRLFKTRFETFDFIMRSGFAQWDRETNTVHAPTQLWNQWTQSHPLSMAYLYNGEGLFDVLKRLFAPPNEDVPDNNITAVGVIDISSDDEDI